MSVEMLQRPARQQARTPVSASPPRLRPKGPVGPDFYRQCSPATSRPKQSAVERLEADKAKYVKSRVALSKQQPVRPPEVRKPLLSPGAALRPTRKTPTQTKTKQEEVQLDLAHLSNLISDVNDGPQSSATVRSKDSKAPEDAATAAHNSPCPAPVQKKERPCTPPRPDRSTPAKVRLKASGPARVEGPGSPGSPAAGTVRRVDVMPQGSAVRTTCRPPQFIRQPLQPVPLHSQFPLRPVASHLFHTRKPPPPSPLKPVVAPSMPDSSPSPPAADPLPAPAPPTLPVFPPPSPAFTRLSSSSSRKRPSLTRSKSDMSDRYSRAGTELERFFNLCGLDPADLQELTGSSSDVLSLARFRSVSAPGSECAGSNRQDEDDEDDEEEAGKAADRVPYGVSVIERNARVIKWLYGLRQAKENATKSTNL
ncbi:protein FAM110A [Acanthochromis polyacanthus]|uniref:protein FAM110A n=1 Tax=Acanthochromis polyacanthus TaxID=80966 RepID=UPI002234338B|nr:protein FAM110A [Acanthochromis polyacanthus]